jgi:hypothetical protein
MSAAAWFNAPQDVEAYRRLAAAVSEWNAYCAPTMETLTADDSELLDELADVAPPQPLAALLPDVTGPMLRRARRQL